MNDGKQSGGWGSHKKFIKFRNNENGRKLLGKINDFQINLSFTEGVRVKIL